MLWMVQVIYWSHWLKTRKTKDLVGRLFFRKKFLDLSIILWYNKDKITERKIFMLKIVLTGGPCAGKTSVLEYITDKLGAVGYKIDIVPETATEVFEAGYKPGKNITQEEFQRLILVKQLEKEEIYNKLNDDKRIVFFDRGILDACAYAPEGCMDDLFNKYHLTYSEIYSRYDAILHLVTTADGAEEFYLWNDPNSESEGNNPARKESPEEARIADKKTLNIWIGHPHLRVIDNSTDFKGKLNKVVAEVYSLLGIPEPVEIERKFLIRKPTQEELEKVGYISKTEILQTYLNSSDNAERRVRCRGNETIGFAYFYTEKSDISQGKRFENERRISKKEYETLLKDKDPSLEPISKIRHCFVYKGRYFEMDFYPFSEDYAIMEIELNDIQEKIELPEFEIIKEVTDDINYKNHTLAMTKRL